MDRTTQAVSLFNKKADLYQDKYMDTSPYHDTFDFFCDAISKHQNPSILDVACGPGNVTYYLLQKYPHFNIHGIDLSERMIALAKVNNPAASFAVQDIRKICELEHQYNGVICGFGLPYLSKAEAEQFILHAAERLTTDGILYLSTMEDDYSKSGFVSSSSGKKEQVYTYYHQAEYLIAMMNKVGFEVIFSSRKNGSNGGKAVVELIIIAKLLSKRRV